MLKIVGGQSEGRGVTLHLEGQVIGPWVEELDRACRPILGSGERLSLDLSEVSFVSRQGGHLLWKLRDEHAVTLLHCSRFVAEQLKALDGTVR
jgi:hypothetical protein